MRTTQVFSVFLFGTLWIGSPQKVRVLFKRVESQITIIGREQRDFLTEGYVRRKTS